MTFETTEFERVPDMHGYYISSNGPASGEFAPIEQLNELKRREKILMESLKYVKDRGGLKTTDYVYIQILKALDSIKAVSNPGE